MDIHLDLTLNAYIAAAVVQGGVQIILELIRRKKNQGHLAGGKVCGFRISTGDSQEQKAGRIYERIHGRFGTMMTSVHYSFDHVPNRQVIQFGK